MLNCLGIDKLHGFIMQSVMLAVGRISRENYYSFQFSNVGNYEYMNLTLIHSMRMSK